MCRGVIRALGLRFRVVSDNTWAHVQKRLFESPTPRWHKELREDCHQLLYAAASFSLDINHPGIFALTVVPWAQQGRPLCCQSGYSHLGREEVGVEHAVHDS